MAVFQSFDTDNQDKKSTKLCFYCCCYLIVYKMLAFQRTWTKFTVKSTSRLHCCCFFIKLYDFPVRLARS